MKTPKAIPRPVYRVAYVPNAGVLVIDRRTIIDRKGSWVTFRREDGTTVKENGEYWWADSARQAMHRHADTLLYAMTCPAIFDPEETRRRMRLLIDLAINSGHGHDHDRR
jgi:hypothetical protein